jgi:hypothetical protein
MGALSSGHRAVAKRYMGLESLAKARLRPIEGDLAALTKRTNHNVGAIKETNVEISLELFCASLCRPLTLSLTRAEPSGLYATGHAFGPVRNWARSEPDHRRRSS